MSHFEIWWGQQNQWMQLCAVAESQGTPSFNTGTLDFSTGKIIFNNNANRNNNKEIVATNTVAAATVVDSTTNNDNFPDSTTNNDNVRERWKKLQFESWYDQDNPPLNHALPPRPEGLLPGLRFIEVDDQNRSKTKNSFSKDFGGVDGASFPTADVEVVSSGSHKFRQISVEEFNAWMDGYEKLVDFYKIHGHSDPKEHKKDNTSLYHWCARQRFHYRYGKLRPDFKRLLDRVEFNFSPNKVQENKDIAWDKKFEAYKKLVEKGHDGTREMPASISEKSEFSQLLSWAELQRKYLKQGSLDPDKERRLKDIGFDFFQKNQERGKGILKD